MIEEEVAILVPNTNPSLRGLGPLTVRHGSSSVLFGSAAGCVCGRHPVFLFRPNERSVIGQM